MGIFTSFEKQELYDLRGIRCHEFDDLPRMLEFVEQLLPDPMNVPLVCGYRDFSPENWKVRTLAPYDQSSRLTLENFLEGLRAVERMGKKEAVSKGFHGMVHMPGLEGCFRDEHGQEFLNLFVGTKGSRTYSCNLAWAHDDGREPYSFYQATARIERPSFEKVMERYMGPRKNDG
jgi:hypothetical protein